MTTRAPQRPVVFLVADHTGHGGLARAVVNLANRLAATGRRTVRMVSLFAAAETPRYPLDPRVELEVLLDVRRLGLRERRLHGRASRLTTLPGDGVMSRLTDHALTRWLQRVGAVTVVSTRPSLHLAVTTWREPDLAVVGWDHKNFPTRFAQPWLAEVMTRAVPDLDRFVVLTDADRTDYVDHVPVPADRVRVLRNALSWPTSPLPAPLDARVVLGAGRLAPVKGFGRMIDAYAPVARKHPDWRLVIHGEGNRRCALHERAARLGLGDHVGLPGYADDFARVLRGAAVFAMTSKAEGFPMVLLEAMAEGLPLVAMDCPRGPGEIVRDGENGLLVADGDGDGFTRALLAVVEDPVLRGRLGRTAWEDSRQYAADRVTRRWLDLLDELDA